MTATLRATATEIINRVAAECKLTPITDPYNTTDENFTTMTYLLNIAGEELCQLYPWEFLVREHAINTLDTDSGNYDLPEDFLYMINQTGWERAENVPLYGPLSGQDWQYLLGRDLVSHTIYASFRIKEGKFSIFPQPPPNGLDIHFEYIARNWVVDSETGNALVDRVNAGADTPLFDRTLLSRYLKVKWKEANSLDTTKAQADLNQMFQMLTAHDKGAQVLTAGRNARGYPYLNSWTSVPDTGYGST
jgi:hypothetical protein